MASDDDVTCPKCGGTGQRARRWCGWCGGDGKVTKDERRKYLGRHRMDFCDVQEDDDGG